MFNFQVNVWFDPVVALTVILSGPETKANPFALKIKTKYLLLDLSVYLSHNSKMLSRSTGAFFS